MRIYEADANASISALGALALSAMLHAAPSAPVADAAMQGDRDAVRALLKQAADVNAAQGDGMTALHWAAMKDDAELVQTLLFAGANVRATTRIGAYTPLILAAKSGSAAVIAPLLEVGRRRQQRRPSNGTTALMLAAASGNADAVDAADRRRRQRQREGAGARAQRRRCSPRRPTAPRCSRCSRKHGADLKATSKVADLAALSKDPAALREITFGNPAAAGRTAGRRAQRSGAPGGAAVRGGRGGRGSQTAGVDRNYQLNELVAAQGGLTPLLLAAREGHIDVGAGAARRRRRRQPGRAPATRPARC